MISAPLAASLAVMLAACDASNLASDHDPSGANQDAAIELDEAGTGDAGVSPFDAGANPFDASAADAQATSDAAGNGRQDAAESARAEASTPDADAQMPASDAGAADTGASDPLAIASALDRLFIDVPCAAGTPTPLADGATCQHPSGAQHIEKAVSLGGNNTTVYDVKLRVRGIWEPTKIEGGERPDQAHPFTIGGMLPAGTGASDAINYQQFSIRVSEPEQTYWLNDHQYLAHDIHKEDYTVSLPIAGGARVTVVMNDGNERQIANWTKSYFSDVPPYDKTPSLGQSLRLDVVSVAARP